CGGTHRLFGFTWALHLHLAKGGKKTAVWQEAEAKIKKYKNLARELQNTDGSFSTDYFNGKANSLRSDRINTTGHVFEWLALALDADELLEPWVKNAGWALSQMILDAKGDPVPGGSLFHATHGLHIYRARVFGLLNAPGAPLVPLPPKKEDKKKA